ncbi:hypothetical protein ALC53_09584 [Atta colombica]|uniref:AMP-dependent synthetase/ligase domain-containing protein n=1 Tax=Atta colombica TaxID=520822 RepID=A0A195B6B4_9HYME|nr:hypothetical protein ALC53_09584 [Atta colombica]
MDKWTRTDRRIMIRSSENERSSIPKETSRNRNILTTLKEHSGSLRIENDILIGEEVSIYRECTNIGALVLEKMRSRPEFVAQVEVAGTKTTFAEMTEKSVKCALWLREQAVQPGDIIGICTHNHLESYVHC